MKARHQFREEAERQYDIQFSYPYIMGEIDDIPEDPVKHEWIEAKIDELHEQYLVEYYAILCFNGRQSGRNEYEGPDLRPYDSVSDAIALAKAVKERKATPQTS